jgi:hypothetical protein
VPERGRGAAAGRGDPALRPEPRPRTLRCLVGDGAREVAERFAEHVRAALAGSVVWPRNAA